MPDYRIVTVELKPPYCESVERCVLAYNMRRARAEPVSQVNAVVQSLLKQIFPRWKLRIEGWLGSLDRDALFFEVDQPKDDLLRFRQPADPLAANMLVTTAALSPSLRPSTP